MFKKRVFFIYFILFLIFVLALFLRLYKLEDFPVGFHIDEASLGYNAYSLFLTGKDDNGNSFPLYIDMFGDNRPSGYHYLTIPSIKLLGLNEFSTRFPAALFGSSTVFLIFFFAFSVFRDEKLSLISALLIAIAPWHIVLSRASAEVIVALFFIVFGFALFFYGLQKKSTPYILSSAVLMIASFFFYHTPRVFVPGIFLIFILMFLPIIKKSSKNYKVALLSSFVFVSAIAFFLVFGVSGGTGRFNQVSIFNSFETDFFQKQQIQEDAIAGSKFIQSRFFHNKVTNVLLVFTSNYFDYFGFNFLFIKGGMPIWYSIPRVGLLYLLAVPFILIGIYNLIREKNIYYKTPLVWILIAPVVPAITMDDIPNINRAVVMFPMLEIIAGFGFLSFIKKNKYKKQFTAILAFLLLLNCMYFLHQYFYNAKTHNPWYRNNGFSKMMSYVRENYDNYDLIAMSKFQGGIYPLVLFYMQYDPKQYQKEGSPKNKDYTGFGKFFFIPQDCPSLQAGSKVPLNKRVLYVDKGDCPMGESFKFERYDYVYREDKTKAFRIVYD